MLSFEPYDFVIFDLDGTLYDERLYLTAAYKCIAEYLSGAYHTNVQDIESFLINGFQNDGRANLLNKLCSLYHIPESAITDMLSLMRTVDVKAPLPLYPQMKALIDTLVASDKQLFIVTNGNTDQQRNKINSINWQGLDSHFEIVFANTIKPKPDRAAFDYLVHRFHIIPARTLFIGDTQNDIDFASNSGINFIHAHEILMA